MSGVSPCAAKRETVLAYYLQGVKTRVRSIPLCGRTRTLAAQLQAKTNTPGGKYHETSTWEVWTMTVVAILGWIIAGLIVGALARFLVPGRQSMNLGLTIVLGVVGALVGGLLSSLLFGPAVVTDATGTHPIETAWPGWIMAILGGVLVLLVVSPLISNRTTGSRLP
jgi:uncharacterized membrane protein YeaQ/YmgE (transglycosylase-associated protein family)